MNFLAGLCVVLGAWAINDRADWIGLGGWMSQLVAYGTAALWFAHALWCARIFLREKP